MTSQSSKNRISSIFSLTGWQVWLAMGGCLFHYSKQCDGVSNKQFIQFPNWESIAPLLKQTDIRGRQTESTKKLLISQLILSITFYSKPSEYSWEGLESTRRKQKVCHHFLSTTQAWLHMWWTAHLWPMQDAQEQHLVQQNNGCHYPRSS